MIPRLQYKTLLARLNQFPAVALLGPRQVGKTTLAYELTRERSSIYLDLEAPKDLAKLSDPSLYLASHQDKLVILDEVQRMPELFQSLRGLIDEGKRKGITSGQFLLLGSASIELLKQSSETLAGRIAYLELSTLTLLETGQESSMSLWSRGGFPDSYLATNDQQSFIWRENFIRTYLERDIPQLGPRVPVETLRRFWMMLAHNQGGLHNAAQLARGLSIDGKTVARYLDLLVDLLLVRKLMPWSNNVGKRLVKSPKVYVRDSGILHALLGLSDLDALFGHAVVGGSWEGFCIENCMSIAPLGTEAYFYRTSAGAEVDLVLRLPNNRIWSIEIKRSLTPTLSKGFYEANKVIKPTQCFVIYAGNERYPLADGVEAIGLFDIMTQLSQG